MPIPNPTLDDISFEQLMEIAIKNIPLLSKKWTNFNPSDPGITILELLAWLTELKVYGINKIPKKNYLKFLKLLGIQLLKKKNVELDVTLKLENGTRKSNHGSLRVPEGFPFINSKDEIFIETKEALHFIPSLNIDRFIVYSDNRYVEVSMTQNRRWTNSKIDSNIFNKSAQSNHDLDKVFENYLNVPFSLFDNTKPFFYLFGSDPIKNNAFYLCLNLDKNELKKGDRIEVSFYLYEKDLPSKGYHGCDHKNSLTNYLSTSILIWEYAKFNSDKSINSREIEWTTFSKTSDFRDDTKSFSKTGKISFKFDFEDPSLSEEDDPDFFKLNKINVINDSNHQHLQHHQHRPEDSQAKYMERQSSIEKKPGMTSRKGTQKFWVRCRLIENNTYYTPPRVEAILTNTVSCVFGYTTEVNLKNKSSLLSKTNIKQPETPISKSEPLVSSPNIEDDLDMLSNGLVNQVFEVPDKAKLPIQKLNFLTVHNKYKDLKSGDLSNPIKWHGVDDFDSSEPLDNHYMVLDENEGLFQFGDGENGKIPEFLSSVVVKYRYGKLKDKFIKELGYFRADLEQIQNPVTRSDLGLDSDISLYRELIAINFFPSSIYQPPEQMSEAIIRSRFELLQPSKIVSLSDCEYIAKQTPGLRVGRVRAKYKRAYKNEMENTIIVSALPYSFYKKVGPVMLELFNKALQSHLDEHKLITTTIEVVPIKYVEIAIDVKLRVTKGIKTDQLQKKYVNLLSDYFSPIKPNSLLGNKTWDFGQNIYRSKIVSYMKLFPEVEYVFDLNLLLYVKNGSYFDTNGNIIIEDLNLVYLKNVFISFE